MSRRESKPASSPYAGVRSRWGRIGPGLILAILVSVVVWMRERPDLEMRGDRPMVERAPLAAHGPVATPDVSDLLKHADALALTPHERKVISRLVKQWETESAARRGEMNQAAEAFNRFIREAQQQGRERRNAGAGLAEIQRNAAEASALTTEWLARKASFWQQGLAALTSAQQQRAKSLIQKPVPPSRPSVKGETG